MVGEAGGGRGRGGVLVLISWKGINRGKFLITDQVICYQWRRCLRGLVAGSASYRLLLFSFGFLCRVCELVVGFVVEILAGAANKNLHLQF